MKSQVHSVLAHSYLSYFIFFLVAICLDFVFPLKIFETSQTAPVGLGFLILGTLLVFWAQHSSRKLPAEINGKEAFHRGPYRYTRSPTHYGLFFLILGFGMLINALFIVVFSILAFVITKLVFIKKQEKLLAEKYGTHYLEYKKSVRL